MKNKYATKFSLKEVCETIGVELPEEYKNMEDEVFSDNQSFLGFAKVF